MDDPNSSIEFYPSLTNLPDDCLFHIYQYLKNCSDRNSFGLTCRRLLKIQNSACSSLVFQLSPKGNAFELYARYLPKLLSRFPNLSSVSLANCTELGDSALTGLQLCGSTLRSLSLYCCLGITDDTLATVSFGCPYLVSITLYRCNITDTGLEWLAKSCLSLENINLSYCLGITDRGIHALSRDCRRIRSLMMSSCKGITGTGFEGCSPSLAYVEADLCFLSAEGLLSVFSGGGIVYLNISSPRTWFDRDELMAIGSGFAANLRFLNLRLCRFVSDEFVEAIAKGCPLLEEWNLAVCHRVHLPGWEAIGLNCRNLKILHVNRCQNLCDQGLMALRDGCNQLKLLYMHGCRRVSNHGLETFKLTRQDVKVMREECVCVGPWDTFFTHWLQASVLICCAFNNSSGNSLALWILLSASDVGFFVVLCFYGSVTWRLEQLFVNMPALLCCIICPDIEYMVCCVSDDNSTAAERLWSQQHTHSVVRNTIYIQPNQ